MIALKDKKGPDTTKQLEPLKQNKDSKLNQNSINDIFGLEKIPNHCKNLVITNQKEECLILTSNGFNAVSFKSENHLITEEQIIFLKAKTDFLFICYGNSKLNQKLQTEFSKKHTLLAIHLPKDLNNITDYFKALKAIDFMKIIDEVIEVAKNNENDNESTIFHRTEDYLNKFYKFRFNQISLEIECYKKGYSDWLPLNENSLFIELQKKGIKISINNLLAILKSEYVEPYNPIKTYFEGLPTWDNKTDFISTLCSYVKVEDKEQFVYHFKKWCVRTVKCALNESYFNKQAFILVHKGQSSGKSTWCRFICPPKLKQYIAEDIKDDKDSRILLCKNFIINLDELAVLSRKEINSLKSFFSKTVINERLPYDRKNSIIPRVASFIGSTNMTSFLNDETGSVRWLCFELTGQIDFNYDKIDINNLWAQAYSLALTNFDCELSIKDIKENEKRNSQFKVLSLEYELVSKYFSRPEKGNGKFMTASDVFLYLRPLSVKISNVQIGKALTSLGYGRVKKNGAYGYYLDNIPI